MPLFQASALFSDHAVLARDREIRVFGAAQAGVRVTVALSDARGNTLAQAAAREKDGRFLCALPPQKAQTGCTLTLSCGGEKAAYEDIAVGEVFLAGGQSNMELALQNADGGPDCIARHHAPPVRYYNVPQRARWDEEARRANAAARWVPILPGTAGDMSAVAYFFAMKAHEELNVPVGVVDCYWGGTSITCWLSGGRLNALAEGRRYAEEYEKLSAGITMEAYLEKEKAFWNDMDRWNGAVAALKAENPGIAWAEISEKAGPCPWNPPAGPGSPFRPGGLYETMLRRVIPLTLSGVLFYQGEEDTARTARYQELLTALILEMREEFLDEALPFLNVQLPMWIADGAQDSFTWPRLRLAQQRTADSLPRTGLAVLLDQGEYDNIHPTAKRVVGERLWEEAKRVMYPGLPYEEAPFALEKRREGSALRVFFSAVLCDRGEGEFLMEIAGEDGVYFPADVSLCGKELVLTSPSVPRPASVRYGWTDYARVRLFGPNGWPLRPFELI